MNARSIALDDDERTKTFEMYIESTDAYAVVYHANWFRFMDRAAQRAFERAEDKGGHERWFKHANDDVAFAETSVGAIEEVKYARAGALGERATCSTTVLERTPRAIVLHQRLVNDDQEVFISANVTYEIGGGDERWRARAKTPERFGAYATTSIEVYRDEQTSARGVGVNDVLRFFERARTDMIGGARALAELRSASDGATVVVSRLDAEFPRTIVRPLARIRQCEVRTRVTMKRLQVVFHQELWDLDENRCVAAADVACVCLDSTTMKPRSCPRALVDVFAPFAQNVERFINK